MRQLGRLVVALAVAIGIVWLGWEIHEAGHFSRARLVAVADDAGALAPLLVGGAMVLAVVIGPIPTVPIAIAAGVLFGPGLGMAVVMAGALTGAVASFWIARLAGRPVAERLLGGHAHFCARCGDHLLFWSVLGARLVPVISFALVSYAAGLTAITTRAFAVATAIGMLPMTYVYVVLGASVTAETPWMAAAAALALLLVLALPWLVERYDPWGLATRLHRFAHGEDHPPTRDGASGNDSPPRP